MFKLKSLWADLRAMKQYILVATLVFAVSIYIGATNDSFSAFLTSQMEGLGQIMDVVESSSNPTLTMIIIIFLNNAIKSIIVMFAGALFGLIPMFFLVVNGMIIGFVVRLITEHAEGMSGFEVVAKGLLPHGILEIPAIIIACAYGLKMGQLLFAVFGALISNHNKLDQVGQQYKLMLKRCAVLSVYLVITLLIASIIESTVTGWLLEM